MSPHLFFQSVGLAVFILFGLSSPLLSTDNQVTIATFNVEWLGYPENSGTWSGNRDSQLDQAADEILAMDADIIALQELVIDDLNGNALTDLIAKLNAKDATDTWGGVWNSRFSFWWAPDFVNYPAQRQAFIWRTSNINYVGGRVLLSWLEAGDPRFGSGRLPVLIEVHVNVGGFSVPLNLVNLHLKCCTGSDDRRRDSMLTLIQDLRTSYDDKPVIVLGDFNVADRGGANGEIAEWGFYADNDSDGAPDYFHGAGKVPDVWDDLDHIMLSDELLDPYTDSPSSVRNVIGTSLVSDHAPIITTLTWDGISPDYSLVWSDEFNQPDGSAPNPANWVHETGGWGWGNWEEQYYTESLDNTRIENGQLVIELHEDTENAYPNNDYTSGRLRTKGLHEWTYGRMEARIRLPYGDAGGLWPAFWMLGSNIDDVGWPDCGEIDIMEYLSVLQNEAFGTIHGPGYAGGQSYSQIYDFGEPVAPPEPPALTDPYDPQYYHEFAMEWEPDRIRWFIDDVLYHEATPSDVQPNPWVFDHDFFIILNLAIGGTAGGTIDARDLVFPTQMLVDYVRVYSKYANPELNLTKTGTLADENSNGFADVGETIDYAFVLQNTGNVDLTNVTLTDPGIDLTTNFGPPTNLLINGGFESGDSSGWVMGGAIVTSATESGSYSLRLDGAGNSYPMSFQLYPASPGETFNLSGYMYVNEALPLNSTFGLFKIVFRDGSGKDLVPASVSIGNLNTSNFPGAESQPFINSSNPVGTWVFSEAQAVAPEGTTEVMLIAMNVDLSAATIFFDSVKAFKANSAPALDLPSGEIDSNTYSGSYVLTESDINAGWVHNTAEASSDQLTGVTASSKIHLPVDNNHDTDGDGFVNLLERALGLDIFSANPKSMGPVKTLIADSGDQHLQLSYRRRSGGSGNTGIDYKADGMEYTVQVSDDLQEWHSGSLYVEEIGSAIDNGDSTETVTVRDVSPITGTSRFIRLRVVEAP